MKAIARVLIAATLLVAGMRCRAGGRYRHTRLLVTHVRVPPAKIGMWLELQRNEVVPALKKAGIKDYTTYQTVIGEVAEFVIVRPFAFTEMDSPDLSIECSAPTGAAAFARSSASARIDASLDREPP